MKYSRNLLLSSLFLLSSASIFAQNPDSVKAYILEFIQPDVNIQVSYSSYDIEPKYEKKLPQNEKTEEFIEQTKEKYETSKDPMDLLLIGQTYTRMNRRAEGAPWMERAAREIEEAMKKYPDSIDLVESSILLYIEIGNFEKAIEYAQVVTKHYETSDALFMEAILYSFAGQFEKGLETTSKGIEQFPEEGKWFISRILNESQLKMQKFNFGSDEYTLEENRIDKSFITDAYRKNPDLPEIQLMSVFGEFLLFAYDEVYPSILKRFAGLDDYTNFTFEFDENISAQLDDFKTRLIELSKKKEFKKWHPIYYTLGNIYMFKSDYKNAIKYLEKSIELMKPEYRSSDNNVRDSYSNLMSIYLILDDFEKAEEIAIQQATAEVNIDPNPNHYVNMALFRIVDKDYTAGLTLLDQAIGIDSTAIDAYTYKAFVSMLNGELDESLVLLEKPQAMNPDDLLSFKAIIFYSLLLQSTEFSENLLSRLEAYDPTDTFVKEARRLLKTE